MIRRLKAVVSWKTFRFELFVMLIWNFDKQYQSSSLILFYLKCCSFCQTLTFPFHIGNQLFLWTKVTRSQCITRKLHFVYHKTSCCGFWNEWANNGSNRRSRFHHQRTTDVSLRESRCRGVLRNLQRCCQRI